MGNSMFLYDDPVALGKLFLYIRIYYSQSIDTFNSTSVGQESAAVELLV